ncbi:L,D-transpeptidase family protein [Acidiphilium sp. AL]|uniref:L,D-transpeptidase family protein n=1 Tax=Acidiphilium iwatense TaxID=768198 RepID=A0ABS9DTV9_9PROT|nr:MULTISPECIES: L,D-transpeptidase family protein [Acidiphilium]MCF3946117.1 L,D-transpeptidase family protein [Acidiphilium iwatense]MCU4160987.1 L,D-transpeptidase family protein [Acidiphilium sp. AL]
MTARVAGDGFLRLGGRQWRVSIGERGIVARKEEGDCGTPCGVLPLRRVLFRADRLAAPRCAVPIEPIARDDGWCDDPAHPDYNRMIRLPHPAHHEELWRADGLYDVIGVLGWNDAPPIRGAGSAIFLHVARADYAPTAGCVALALPDLLEALAAGLTAIETG